MHGLKYNVCTCTGKIRVGRLKYNEFPRDRDEFTFLNEIDAMEVGADYEVVDPDVRLRSEHIDFQNPEIKRLGLKRQWKYKLTDTGSSIENPMSTRLDNVDLPLRSENLRNYHRIRDSIASLNVALSEYARKLSAYVSYSSTFREKYMKCRKKFNQLNIELKGIIKDRIKAQESLTELRPKYNMIENALKASGKINQEKKKMIEKIRVSRDKCIQTVSNRKGVIANVRDQNAELKRHLTAKLGRLY